MKTLLLGLLFISQSNAFAAFNAFQCTTESGEIQFTKSWAYKDDLEERRVTVNRVDHYQIQNTTLAKRGAFGDIETFTFQRHVAGESYLCSLVISEDSPKAKTGTAILYRLNEDGMLNHVVERGMNCKVE